MREMLIRLIYCEMLGVECPWGYIHAVKMTQSSNIMDKRVGKENGGEGGGGVAMGGINCDSLIRLLK